MFDTAQVTASYRTHTEDRIDVIAHGLGVVLVVADGAGGISGGAKAAETITTIVRAHTDSMADIRDADQWATLLRRIDGQISDGGGQATAVVAAVFDDGVAGASVGDSAAWLIEGTGHVDLTSGQVRKPLVGSGRARPVGFHRGGFEGTLLLASDGLVRYASPVRICQVAGQADMNLAVGELVDLVRLKSGALRDDVAVILCRRRT